MITVCKSVKRFLKKVIMSELNVTFDPNFISSPEKYFNLLEKEIVYLKNVKLYGRHSVPRLMAAYGDSLAYTYSFSGIKTYPRPWTSTLHTIKRMVEAQTSCKYNFCLVNKYRNGYDSIGKHKDDEEDLELDYPIACVSFGQQRTLKFSKPGCKFVKYDMTDGSLLVMHPPTNRYWFHEIPKEPLKKDIRISLTFRKIKMLK